MDLPDNTTVPEVTPQLIRKENRMSQTTSPVAPRLERTNRTGARRVAFGTDPRYVSDEEIAKRAYERFVARGSTHGSDQEDWAAAQHELMALPVDETALPMLRSLNDLERYTVSATDGDVGSVVDFLLDDERWTVRYLVVNAGKWLSGSQVLVSPISFRETEWSTRRFHLALTKDKVKSAPSVDVDLPVSRQHERDFHRYYGFPYYWGSEGAWGAGAYPELLYADGLNEPTPGYSEEPAGDAHLRSAKELRRYHIDGKDGAIGHVHDFIVDDHSWEVRYLVIDTSNWWSGKKVLVAPNWVNWVSWEDRKVHIDLSRQTIKDSPEWNPTDAINREYETRIYDYYGRPAYWSNYEQPDPSGLTALTTGIGQEHANQEKNR